MSAKRQRKLVLDQDPMSQTKNRMVLLCWNEHFDWMMKGIWLVSTNQSAVFQNSIVILRWNKHSDWILQGIWLVSTIQSTLFYNSNLKFVYHNRSRALYVQWTHSPIANLKFVYHNRSRALYVQWTHSPIANQSVFSKVNFQVPNSLALNGYRDKPRLTEKSKAWLSFAWLSFAKPKKNPGHL